MEIIAAAISATAAIIGTIVSSFTASKGMQKQEDLQTSANAANVELYKMQREDAAKAMQTRVTDLKAAGLNPALATGASEVAQPAQMQAPDLTGSFGQMAQSLQSGISSVGDKAIQGVQNYMEAQKQKAEIQNMQMQNEYLRTMSEVNEARARELEQKYGQSSELFGSQKKYLESQIDELNSRIDFYNARREKVVEDTTWQQMRNGYMTLFKTDIPHGMPVGQVTSEIIKGAFRFGLSGNNSEGFSTGNKDPASIVSTLAGMFGLDVSGSSSTVNSGVRDPDTLSVYDEYLDSLGNEAIDRIRASEAARRGKGNDHNSFMERSKSHWRNFKNKWSERFNRPNPARVHNNDLLDLK